MLLGYHSLIVVERSYLVLSNSLLNASYRIVSCTPSFTLSFTVHVHLAIHVCDDEKEKKKKIVGKLNRVYFNSTQLLAVRSGHSGVAGYRCGTAGLIDQKMAVIVQVFILQHHATKPRSRAIYVQSFFKSDSILFVRVSVET